MARKQQMALRFMRLFYSALIVGVYRLAMSTSDRDAYGAISAFFFLASSSIASTDAFPASVFHEAFPRTDAISRSIQPKKKAASAALRPGAPATLTYTGLVV